ncbi:MAG: VOC family protein [Ilumatobacteraceae bacterium]
MTDDATSNAPMRSHSFQVVVDCHDPHELADWWAETLGWEVEPSPRTSSDR